MNGAFLYFMSGHISMWDYFTEKFPVKVRSIEGDDWIALNYYLEKDIRGAGQGALSAAKCYRTHWKMHEVYDSFSLLNNAVLDFAKKFPLASRTDEQGNPEEVPMKVLESWGLIYKKDDSTDTHTHWPALWSYCYCVKSCENCTPLSFPTAEGVSMAITTVTAEGISMEIDKLSQLSDGLVSHKAGQIILWPAWLTHKVSEQECDHDRIVVSGNIYTDF